MRGLIVLLVLGIGGYFLWRFASPEARVQVRNFAITHAFKVVLIIAFIIGWFYGQAIVGSVKLF